MLKFQVLFILPILLFLGCGGYEEVFYNGLANGKEDFTDERDGKTYKYVKIGNQIWMAENLNYETQNTKCYDDDPHNCEVFGKLYDWETAKIICPDGWHLPDDNAFLALRNFVEAKSGCTNCAGIILKANSALWISNKGTDEFGFTALPGGFYREETGGFNENKVTAGFWSATKGSESGSAHFRYFKNNNNSLNLAGFYIDRSFANVRCIKD